MDWGTSNPRGYLATAIPLRTRVVLSIGAALFLSLIAAWVGSIGWAGAVVTALAGAQLAWILFSIYSGMHAVGPAPVQGPYSVVLAALQLVIGVLLTVAGARAHARGGYMRSVLAFALAFALVFLSRYWADVLLGDHSVMG
jgi:hypothetical protein